jgi:hypothetical protein
MCEQVRTGQINRGSQAMDAAAAGPSLREVIESQAKAAQRRANALNYLADCLVKAPPGQDIEQELWGIVLYGNKVGY